MKKINIRFATLSAAFVLVCVLLCSVPAFAAVSTSGFEYEINSSANTVTITGYTGSSRILDVPEKIGIRNVTAIGDAAFLYGDYTAITLPDTVTAIGNSAFNCCENLTSITLPKYITSIGSYTFSGCHSLTSVKIPDTVTSIGDGAFAACMKLQSITLPAGLNSIGSIAFTNCSELKSVTIHSRTATMGANCIPAQATIYGYDGSTAQAYAQKNGNPFIDITPKTNISTATVTLQYTSVVYSGTANKPTVKVTCGGKTLIAGTDYTVAYKNNVNVGPADVVISGCGKYTGTQTVLFAIRPLTVTGVSAARKSTGISLSWNPVPGVTGYTVYRSENDGSFTKIAATTAAAFLDKKATMTGVKYSYRIYAYQTVNGKNYIALPSSDLATYFVAMPQNLKAANTSTGIKLTWDAVAGIKGYVVYRSVNGGSYVKLAATATETYTDTADIISGETYQYKVYAYYKSGSNYYSAPISCTKVYLQQTVLATPARKENGLSLSWSPVAGATSYSIYRSTDGGSYVKVTAVTGTTYLDTAATTTGTKYSYKIYACATVNGTKYISVASAARSTYYTATPSTLKATNTSTGIKLTWDAVEGRTGYVVYRSTNGVDYVKIKATTATSYTDTAANDTGVVYSYRVRAYVKPATTIYYGAPISTVKAYVAPTSILSVKSVSTGMNVTWDKVDGAIGYYVYCSVDGGKYTKLKKTTATHYLDTTATTKGSTYSYKIYAYVKDNDGTICLSQASTVKSGKKA